MVEAVYEDSDEKYHYSDVVERVFITPPSTVKSIKVSDNGDGTSKIYWTKVSDLTYEVYYKNTSDTDYNFIETTTSNSVNIDSSKLESGYEIAVKAYISKDSIEDLDIYSSSNWAFDYDENSKVYTITDGLYRDGIIPKTPSGLSITLSLTGITLKWNAMSDVTGYKIYRTTSKNGSYSKIKTITNAGTTSYTDKSVSTGKTYYYKITAYNTLVATDYGSPYTSIKSKLFVKGVTTTSRTVYANSVKLNWNKVSGVTGYKIYRATSKNGKYTCVKTITSASTKTYTNKSLKTGKAYYYKIRAYYTKSGTKYYSAYSSVITKNPYARVTISSITYNSNGYNLIKWGKVSAGSGYQIYRSTSKNGTYTKIKTISSKNTLSYKDKNIVPGTMYYYEIRAVKGTKVGQFSSKKKIGTGTISQQVNKQLTTTLCDLGNDDVNDSMDYLISKAYSTAKSKEGNNCSTTYKKIKAIYRYIEMNLDHSDDYNCWHYSGTLCAALRRLGIDAYLVCGDTTKSGGGWTGHTWVIVEVSNTKYILDPSIDKHLVENSKSSSAKYDRFFQKASSMTKYYKEESDENIYGYIVDFRDLSPYFCYYICTCN